MALTDVWRNIGREINVFWKGRFDRVPQTPGVYGWYYPLRLTSDNLEAFLDEINTVFRFDARTNGPARQEVAARFAWEQIAMAVAREGVTGELPPLAVAAWENIAASEERFLVFRRALLKSTLLMPPLYVGKTKNLNVRCSQHLAGTGRGDFHARYQDYASRSGLPASEVSDLLFACIQLSRDTDDDTDHAEDMETVLEEVLKRVGRPPFSAR